MALTIRVETSAELFLAPGEPRGFAFVIPPGILDTALFSLAFPSRPRGEKRSLWTIAHGTHTEGSTGGEFPRHRLMIHWVTIQVADPPVPTEFTIDTVAFVP
jgi:hypothetical protein